MTFDEDAPIEDPGSDPGVSGRARLLCVFQGPGAVARICAAYVAVISLVVVAIELPKRLRDLSDVTRANASLSFADREIAGGNSVLADQQLAYEARAIIPPGAPYRLAIGTKVTKQASLSTASLPGWLRYFLMPRRADDRSQWVICYGCDPASLGGRYSVLWQDEYGISVGRLG